MPTGQYRAKVIRSEVRVVGPARVVAVLSTEAEDREGDVIRQGGWNLDSFLRHPVLLSSHDYRSLRSQIGEWEDVKVKGKKLVGTARYYVGEGNAEADWAFKLAERGRAAFSVGFIPLEYDEREATEVSRRGYEFARCELLEVSQVTVPANAEALQLMAKSAGLHPEIDRIVTEMLGDGTATVERKQETGCCCMPGCDDAVCCLVPVCKDHLQMMMAGMPMTEPGEPMAMSAATVVDRAAIPPHSSPKADESAAWDAGAEVAKASGASELRRMHAWVNSDGDPDAKSSYKLPHHRASGEVVWRGVAAATQRMGQMDVPSGDMAGVKAHLRKHYEQFDKPFPGEESVDEGAVHEHTDVDVLGLAEQIAAAVRNGLAVIQNR